MPNPSKTERPVAIVTGGAQRVGRAIVERLAAAGFDIGFTYRTSQDAANALAADLAARGQHAACIGVDFETPEGTKSLLDWARSRFARIDLLVNSASMYVPDDNSFGASEALQRKLMEVNAIAPTSLMMNFAPQLIAERGCVINFADILAERPMPDYSAYCASKAALVASTKAYARRLAPHVRVNGIAPGVIAWPPELPAAAREAYLKRVPLARPGSPGDAADLVHFLATSSTYITGQIIRLDGGRSIA